MRATGSDFDPNKKIDWHIIKQVWPYLMEYRGRVILALICLFGAKLTSVGLPFILKHIVDDLDTKLSGSNAALLVAPLGLLIAYGVVRLLSVLFGELRDTLFGRVTERAMRRVGIKVFEHLHNLDLAFHLDRRTGGLSRDIERGVNGISFIMRFMVFNIVPTFLELILVMGILWQQYDIYFALIVLISVVTYVVYSKTVTDWRTQFIREANMADNKTNSRAVDSLLNFETVKYFANEQHESRLYDTELASWERAKRKNRLTLFALNTGQAIIISISMTTMLSYAAYQVAAGAMSLGDFVLVNAFMLQIFIPLNFLGFIYREIKGSMTNIERMFSLLKVTPKVVDVENAKPLTIDEGRIQFDHVSFYYNKERPILKDVSFVVEPGQKVAIVGASGAGKSTIGKLLFRFYDINGGSIKIDGQSLADVEQHSVRQAIGVVPQDTVLFNATILENVRYGRPSASEEDVKKAIQLAHLDSFIEELPDGYETEVGERGLKLSGGEKQRVAIARTILKEPSILLFDEATSSLDTASEKAVLQAIQEVSQDKSSVIIAHRLSTIIDADKIIVLEKGKVVEQGTHTQLIQLNGRYAALWQLQLEGAS